MSGNHHGNHHDDFHPLPEDRAHLVAPEDACPGCGERRVDCLVWTEDDIVHCTTCGTAYDPLANPEGGDDAAGR